MIIKRDTGSSRSKVSTTFILEIRQKFVQLGKLCFISLIAIYSFKNVLSLLTQGTLGVLEKLTLKIEMERSAL